MQTFERGIATCNLQVATGSVQKAVIVETKKEFNRADGSTLRFDRNACVLVNDKGGRHPEPSHEILLMYSAA